MSVRYQPTAKYNIIYLYTIHDDSHNGKIKVGKTEMYSIKSASQLPSNCPEIIQAAKSRINEQTRTAMVSYDLIHCELAVRNITLQDGTLYQDTYTDDDIHDVLKNSGYRPEVFRDNGRDSEWFALDKTVVFKAIDAYKKGLSIIPADNSPTPKVAVKTITLRDEQAECVEKTINIFKTEDTMLWDCKMRFGKTVTAYELIRQVGFKKSIVITHRPAVEDSWDTDHTLMFCGTNHRFIDKSKDSLDGYDSIMDSANDKKLHDLVDQDVSFVYFASVQDLRGSKRVGGKFNKNNAVFDLDWDLIIVDEAHEGIQDNLGEEVVKLLKKKNTKLLSLTGTAYSLVKDYGNNVYTWTYVDEQKKKKEWDELHPGERNPYADLPTMNILTFDISDAMADSYRFVTTDSAFNFREFFRTWTGDISKDYYPVPKNKSIGDFVHEESVWSFLNLISREDDSTNYPFATEEYRDMFAHTFWIVPGVKEARAFSKLLQNHPFFGTYKIVNVAGEGDEEEQYDIALNKVRSAIKNNSRTITLSCGRLTTGITVKEWTGIMMLSGSAETAVNGYMQAIFRVQSPGVINGKRKENCYVFDFAPDRALKVIGKVHQLSSKHSSNDDEAYKVALGEFMNFCPIIAVEGTEMRTYDVPEMMRQIKRISVESAINSGFDDNTIYLSDAGLTRSDADLDILRRLSDVVAPKKKGQKDTKVLINDHGMTEEERKKAEEAKKKKRTGKQLSPEEQEALEKLKEARKEQQKLFDLLRAVSIRLPLLFYGADADITEIIHLKDFVTLVDDESWQEFMPKGLRKELFQDILRFYNQDVLVGAGLRIRKLAKAADEYPPTIRAAKIVEIIGKFKNPDKETVLTPWRVVNMHLGDTLGGYNFFDEAYRQELDEPRFIEQDGTTADILLNPDVRILELNSKSGLYPLYMAYSLYMFNLNGREIDQSFESLQTLWNEVLTKNIFVLCKTKMAKSITIRTLAGYTKAKVNAIYLPHLLERMKEDEKKFRNKLTNPETWSVKLKEGERMKFDAIVGNPPYQLEGGSGGSNDSPIYQLFVNTSLELSTKTSTLIIPARWFTSGRENLLGDFRVRMLKNRHIKALSVYTNSRDVFPSVEIKGGICYYLFDKEFSGLCDYTLNQDEQVWKGNRNLNDFDVLIRNPKLNEIVKKVLAIALENKMVDSIISNDTPFGISSNPKSSLKNPTKVYATKTSEHNTQLFFIETLHRKIEYVDRNTISKNVWAIDKYKVFIPGAGGSGADPYVLGKPELAPTNSVCSQSYLFAAFDSEVEAKNFICYLKTKTFRVLVSALKISQSCPNRAYKFVPIQDFSDKSEIDWSMPISEIDKLLYTKYGFDDNEIAFIENNIKPLE